MSELSESWLAAYFDRVGYTGDGQPTLATLRALHRLHVAHIPYETIDVLQGRVLDLAPEAIVAKLIIAGRGGGCHESNMLFKRVLAALGFRVDGAVCRSRFGWSESELRPLTHMALRVHIEDETWLADVGFGPWLLTAPLRFSLDGPQATWFEPVRLIEFEEGVRLEVRFGDSWRPVYDIAPVVMHDIDFAAMNWAACTDPQSLFRRRLMVARAAPEARYALRHNVLTVRWREGPIEQRALGVTELADCLAVRFGLPAAPDWRPMLEAAVAAGSPPLAAQAVA